MDAGVLVLYVGHLFSALIAEQLTPMRWSISGKRGDKQPALVSLHNRTSTV
jgi:hypothetical protein